MGWHYGTIVIFFQTLKIQFGLLDIIFQCIEQQDDNSIYTLNFMVMEIFHESYN